ncbi:MAG: AraC family transcriptional regulator, partial [Pseudomonadota bacterium]
MLSAYQTTSVARRDRFDFWREAVCDAYVRLGCQTDDRTDFFGSIEVERYDGVAVSRVSGSRHDVFRRPRDIARAGEHDFLLSLQVKSRTGITQRGALADLRPRDFAIYSSTEPYKLSLTDGFEQLVLQFPKEKLLSRLPNAELLTGLRVGGDSPAGGLVSRYITDFADLMTQQTGAAAALAQEGLFDMIAMSLAALTQSSVELSAPDRHALLRAKAFIQQRLGDDDLNRDLVAAHTGLSVRRLNEIFAREDASLSGYIRRARLDAAAA